MSRARQLSRDTTGHAENCPRPFIEWREVLGNRLGHCTACGHIFTTREVTR